MLPQPPCTLYTVLCRVHMISGMEITRCGHQRQQGMIVLPTHLALRQTAHSICKPKGYVLYSAYISPPVPQTFEPKHREAEATWNHELETSRPDVKDEATTAEANGAEATATEANGAEATTAETNGAEAKRGNLHSAASPWRAFANLKACFLVFILSFSSPGFSNRKPFVLVFPAASIHRHTIRWLRLS